MVWGPSCLACLVCLPEVVGPVHVPWHAKCKGTAGTCFAPCWPCICTPPTYGGLTRDPHREQDALQASDLKAEASMAGTWQGVLGLGISLRLEIFQEICEEPWKAWMVSNSWPSMLLLTGEGMAA